MGKIIDWRLRPPFKTFLGGPLYPNGCQGTMEDVLAEMDTAEVQIGVAPFRNGMNNADGEEMLKQYGARFRYLAHIDPWAGIEKAAEEIEKYVLNGHASGIIMEPGQVFIKAPVKADDRELMYPIYEICQKRNVLVTITFGGLMAAKLSYYNPLYIDNLAIDFPKMRLVLAHGGWPHVSEICHVAYQRGNVYISPDFYLQKMHPCYKDYVAMANGWLRERVIFGSAYAYGTDLKAIVEEYKTSGLTEQALEMVLYHNAASLLGIEPQREIKNVLDK